jgi:hypothetical protein
MGGWFATDVEGLAHVVVLQLCVHGCSARADRRRSRQHTAEAQHYGQEEHQMCGNRRAGLAEECLGINGSGVQKHHVQLEHS